MFLAPKRDIYQDFQLGKSGIPGKNDKSPV